MCKCKIFAEVWGILQLVISLIAIVLALATIGAKELYNSLFGTEVYNLYGCWNLIINLFSSIYLILAIRYRNERIFVAWLILEIFQILAKLTHIGVIYYYLQNRGERINPSTFPIEIILISLCYHLIFILVGVKAKNEIEKENYLMAQYHMPVHL